EECRQQIDHPEARPTGRGLTDKIIDGGDVGLPPVIVHIVAERQPKVIRVLAEPEELSFDLPSIRIRQYEEGLHSRVQLDMSKPFAQKCSNHRRQPYQVLMLRGEDQLGCELTIERPEQILHPRGIHRRCVVLAVCGKNTGEWRPKELAI